MSLYINGQAVSPIEKSKHAYSTDEQEIGTWIDGSTLYEKTILYNQNIDGMDGKMTKIYTITNEDIKFVYGSAELWDSGTNTNYGRKAIGFDNQDGNQRMSVGWGKEYGQDTTYITFYSKMQFNTARIKDIILVIQYTKNS